MFKQRKNFFDNFANAMTQFTGSSLAFSIAIMLVIIWASTGYLFNYSETWQLIINTGTTIVTFLMVFLIQKAQNKDGKAIQLKLNELIASIKGASNRMVDIEDLSEEELNKLRNFYKKLAELDEEHCDFGKSHSIDGARASHDNKYRIE